MNKQVKLNKIMVIMVVVGFVLAMALTVTYYNNVIHKLNSKHRTEIEILKKDHKQEVDTYKYLYEENALDLNEAEAKYEAIKEEYNEFKNNIAYDQSKQYVSSVNRDLTKFAPITITELDEWIDKKAPSNSPFKGKGDVFIKASKLSGLDPKYIVAHAALESAWGTSSISKNKNNYFGIGAFNASPSRSAHTFDSPYDGIISGAAWIANNYTNKGQNTLYKMLHGKKMYAVTDSGNPNIGWMKNINNIMSD